MLVDLSRVGYSIFTSDKPAFSQLSQIDKNINYGIQNNDPKPPKTYAPKNCTKNTYKERKIHEMVNVSRRPVRIAEHETNIFEIDGGTFKNVSQLSKPAKWNRQFRVAYHELRTVDKMNTKFTKTYPLGINKRKPILNTT